MRSSKIVAAFLAVLALFDASFAEARDRGQAWRLGRSASYGVGFRFVASAIANVGLTPTVFPYQPTVQYHVHTSTKTMRPNGTITGYISGTKLTVTAHDQKTVRALVTGIKLISGALTGTTIVQPLYNGGSNPGSGGTGTYLVNISQTVGSSSSPVTFTVQSDQIATLGDLKGVADLSASTASGQNGPVLMTDGYGVQFLRFFGGYSSVYPYLRNLTYNLNGGTDSHNIAWILVGRVMAPSSDTNTFIGFGAAENTPVANQTNFNSMLANAYGGPNAPVSYNNLWSNFSGQANLNRMFFGSQLQVFGMARANNNGLNNATNQAGVVRIGLNETSFGGSTSSGTRAVNVPGFTIGAAGQATTGSGEAFDLYEVDGFLAGEMGTATQMPARFDADMQAAMGNYSIPPITDSVAIGGDSRSAYGTGAAGTYSAQDGSQTNLTSVLGERGYSWSLPASTRIINIAQGGQGIGWLQAQMDVKATVYGMTPRVTAPDYMLGGGHDYLAFFMGSNDESGGQAGYPTTTNKNGRFAVNSTSLGDDMWAGAAYTGSASVSISSGSTSLTAASETGTLTIGSRPTTGTWNQGIGIVGPQSTGNNTPVSPYTMSIQSTSAHSAETTSFQMLPYMLTVQNLINRGFKVLVGADTAAGATAFDTNANAGGRFYYRINNTAMADMDANTGGANAGKFMVMDLTKIQIGGVNVLGYQGWNNGGGPYFADNIHFSENGRRAAITGGDTPQYGYSYMIRRLMGLVP